MALKRLAVYDLKLDNVNVVTKFNNETLNGNYVGIVAGKLSGKAINITITNSTFDCAAQGSDRVVGVVSPAITDTGEYEVYYNSELLKGGN